MIWSRGCPSRVCPGGGGSRPGGWAPVPGVPPPGAIWSRGCPRSSVFLRDLTLEFQSYAAEGGEKNSRIKFQDYAANRRKNSGIPGLRCDLRDLTPEFRDYAAKRRKNSRIKFQSYAAEGGEKSSRVKQNLKKHCSEWHKNQ